LLAGFSGDVLFVGARARVYRTQITPQLGSRAHFLQAAYDPPRAAHARHSLAVATGVLLGTLCGVVAGDVAIRSHVEGIVGIRRDQLEPLANSLGFSLQPSPTYVGQFIIVPLE
jgi:hypothetical protein